jgi:hypothetical protein
MIWPDREAGYCGTLGNRGPYYPVDARIPKIGGNGFGYGSWFGDIMGGGHSECVCCLGVTG